LYPLLTSFRVGQVILELTIVAITDRPAIGVPILASTDCDQALCS
jgi:hypothetical protein